MSETVIKVENLWKQYRLGVIGYGTLRTDLQTWWSKVRGREDPNKKVDLAANLAAGLEGDCLWALRDVSLELKHGEVLGVIGHNGAGKSTLLKILSRVTMPTRGQVKIKGRLASLLEVGTGFHPELTGRENIFLNGTILGMTKEEIRRKFEEIVDFSGIGQFLDTPVKRYSSGMYVRLAFAVAAHLEPEILVVDEVLAVGDAEFQEKCLGKMDEVSKSGRAIIFVSHNMIAVRELCSRAILLEAGQVAAEDNAGSIISTYLNRDRQDEAVIKGEQIEKLPFVSSGNAQSLIKITEIRIRNKNGITTNYFYSDEEIEILATYECLTKIPDLVMIIIVLDEHGQGIMTNSNKDFRNAVYPHEPGSYRASCIFPANLFGGRRFYIALKFLLPGYGKLALNPGMWFEVDYTGLHGKDYFVSPRLPIIMTAADDKVGSFSF
jgi:lipopolysaccharide transport system ATP-binding protein